MKANESDTLLFKPYSNECTTFENVRVLRFQEGSVDIVVVCEMSEKKVFTNTKSFVLYYDTVNSKILNTLQEVKLASEKMKVKYRFKELVGVSDIEKRLKDWNEQLLEVSA